MPARKRPFWRRLLGLVLITYGAAGLALMVGGSLMVASSVSRLDGLAGTIETQRQVLLRSLDATATFLRDATSGTANVQSSLGSTVESARQTAILTRSLAAAMSQLAAASSIEVFGQRPFGVLGGTFTDVADQAATMGTSLDRTADSLARNGTNLGQVTTDLRVIEAEIVELRRQIAGAADGAQDLSAVTHAIDTSRIVLFGLLLWMAAQAVIAIGIGIALLRWRAVDSVTSLLVDREGLPIDDAT